MKVRTGFVSNSSSSSFVIFGKTLSNPEEVLMTLTMKRGDVLVIGDYLSEGQDVFPIDEVMFGAIMKDELFNKFQFVFCYKEVGAEGGAKIKNDLPESFEVFPLEVDYHTTESLEDLENRYLERYRN